uniref:Uncharacterized protein n=1 Tax=Panagrolaimus sp. ES5 TaxID=591445 RepID=A0AC34F885_9BILA
MPPVIAPGTVDVKTDPLPAVVDVIEMPPVIAPGVVLVKTDPPLTVVDVITVEDFDVVDPLGTAVVPPVPDKIVVVIDPPPIVVPILPAAPPDVEEADPPIGVGVIIPVIGALEVDNFVVLPLCNNVVPSEPGINVVPLVPDKIVVEIDPLPGVPEVPPVGNVTGFGVVAVPGTVGATLPAGVVDVNPPFVVPILPDKTVVGRDPLPSVDKVPLVADVTGLEVVAGAPPETVAAVPILPDDVDDAIELGVVEEAAEPPFVDKVTPSVVDNFVVLPVCDTGVVVREDKVIGAPVPTVPLGVVDAPAGIVPVLPDKTVVGRVPPLDDPVADVKGFGVVALTDTEALPAGVVEEIIPPTVVPVVAPPLVPIEGNETGRSEVRVPGSVIGGILMLDVAAFEVVIIEPGVVLAPAGIDDDGVVDTPAGRGVVLGETLLIGVTVPGVVTAKN